MIRNFFLHHIKPGVKQDTSGVLGYTPLRNVGLFTDDILRKTENETSKTKQTPRCNTKLTSGVIKRNAILEQEVGKIKLDVSG